MTHYPSYESVIDASRQIRTVAIKTAVLQSSVINDITGKDIYFKCENLQHIGAFKFRGAYNAISRLSEQDKKAGIIAFSSGNHAQAVARVCQLLNIPSTIVMPKDAPLIKRQATEDYGATVVEYDPETEDREVVAARINADHLMTLIPPFNHPDIIAGQGTSALELIREIPNLDAVVTPCGGGGLLSGTALAVKGESQQTCVIGVEPELADDATQSFHSGQIVSIDYPDTIADGTRTLSLGDKTFAIIKTEVDDMVTVSEASIKEAVRLLFTHLKQVVEPSGALGLAALLDNKLPEHKSIGIIISGGNIDPATLCEIFKTA